MTAMAIFERIKSLRNFALLPSVFIILRFFGRDVT